MTRIPKIPSSEITPEHLYKSRRQFMKGLGLATAGLALAACAPGEEVPAATMSDPSAATAASNNSAATSAATESGAAAGPTATPAPSAGATTDELGDALTSYEAVTNYNNFYEFTTTKERVAAVAKDFRTSPWEVEVGGLVNNPGIYDIDDLRGNFDQEERIYRLRCVEAWSMVIPWIGFPLHKLLQEVDPKPEAKYVRFETLYDPDQMPGQTRGFYDWPYVEGLHITEAMHDLTILATGLYGKHLLPQNGAPVRLVVPWKYGYKSIKSVVRIDLVEEMPASLWMKASPTEYGFYSNVDPDVPHPRWSQATERRIGENGRRDTLLYNGYAEQVAHLYEGTGLEEVFLSRGAR